MASTSIQRSDELSKLSPMVREATTNATPIGWSHAALLEPGDVIMFGYPENGADLGGELIKRLALVVQNDTGATTYISTKANLLVTCFHLDSSEEIRALILKSLYKKTLQAERQSVIAGMKAILGIENYRSYMISEMDEIVSLNIDMEIVEITANEGSEEITFSEWFTQLGSKVKKMFNFFAAFKRFKG